MANTAKMLDLNVEVLVPDSARDEFNAKIATQMVLQKRDDSGTSSSSVVNVDDEDSGSNLTMPSGNFYAFNFGVMRKEEGLRVSIGDQCDRYTEEAPVPVTMQLFPVGDSGGNASGPPCEPSVVRTQWLNLSVPDSGVAAELRSLQQQKPVVKKSRRGPRSQSSQYRGVTFYRRTGRWESHIWDCGKQVYLGGFDTAHTAARAYDRAAIKFRGLGADINFEISDYKEDMEQMKDLSKLEFVHALRRQNTGVSRGSSKYRAAPYKCGRWEAQMGQILGRKPYDKAAVSGLEETTNIDSRAYQGELRKDANGLGGNDVQNLDLNLWISPPMDSAKERGSWRRGEAPPLAALSSLAWKMPPGHNQVAALFPTAAASSGFPSSVIAGFPAKLPSSQTKLMNTTAAAYMFQLPTNVPPQYYSRNN